MKVEVEFKENQKQTAVIDGREIQSDQSGPTQSAPEPYDLFAASLALCAGFYLRTFCQKRNLSDNGFKLSLVISKDEHSSDPYARNIRIEIKSPTDFPKKYLGALAKSVEACTVKKVIQAGPQFETVVI